VEYIGYDEASGELRSHPFSADGTTDSGAYQWPGGGYESTMTRTA
jgi:hypothetical protein